MPLATSYNEQELAVLMAAELGDVATVLGWEPGNLDAGSYERAVQRTLRLYGASDIADATDMDKLEALATWQAWEAAFASLSTRYDIATDGQSLSRSQLFDHALVMVNRAKQAATRYTSASFITVVPIERPSDPYRRTVASGSEFG